MIPNIGICWTWWSLHGFHSNQPAGRMCGCRLMNINLPPSISSGCHFNVLMNWMRLGLFNMLIVATMFDVMRSINLSPLDSCSGFCFWVHFWFIILLNVHPCQTAIFLVKKRKGMQSTFESFDDQIPQSFSVQERHANVHLRSGRHRRCWDANCLRPHRIVLEIDRSDPGEMAGSCLIFRSFASGGDGHVIFKITFECSSPLLL